jgi:hypothetical protein
VANRQLPVFKFITPIQNGWNSFWIRSIASSNSFAFCVNSGYAGCYGASAAWFVRPLILFG